jgi:hypothetical protein
MFGWFRSRRKREEELDFLISCARQGERYAQLRTAVATLDVLTLSTDNDEQFVAEAAAGLSRYLLETYEDPEDEDAVFTAGIFCVVAGNHFSKELGTDFEFSSALGLRILFEYPEDFERIAPAVISSYNTLVTSQPKSMQAIGQTVSSWMSDPSDDNFRRLHKLFGIFCDNIQEAP